MMCKRPGIGAARSNTNAPRIRGGKFPLPVVRRITGKLQALHTPSVGTNALAMHVGGDAQLGAHVRGQRGRGPCNLAWYAQTLPTGTHTNEWGRMAWDDLPLPALRECHATAHLCPQKT